MPTDKSYQTAVVIVPPDPVCEVIQRFRAAHDRHFRRWMPHISLLYPFRPRERWPEAIGPLTEACAQFQTFEVELREFGAFQHRTSYTLWLAPEPTEPIVELQTAMWYYFRDLDDTRKPDGFVPHVTVGQAKGQQQVEQLLSEFRAAWTPVRFRLSDVHLIWRAAPPDDAFRVGQTIPVGQRSSADGVSLRSPTRR